MLKTTRAAIAASTLALAASGFVGTPSATADDSSNEPTSSLQSEPDEFVKYTSSKTHGLPVTANDPSANEADVMVCRWDFVKGGSFGGVSLTDGTLSLSIDPKYTRDYVDLSYQLCSKTEMGPETAIHITVIRLQQVKPQVLTNRRVMLTNANPDPVSCQFIKDGAYRPLYKTVKVAGGSSLTTKVKSGVSRYVCYISSDGSTDAGAGSFKAK